MNSLFETLFTGTSVSHSLFVLSLTALLGMLIGKIHVRGISLGIGGVMFSGLIISASGLTVNHELLDFLKDAGLALFVYMIGLQVGPSLSGSFEKQGFTMCLLALFVVILGALLALMMVAIGLVPTSVAVGLLAGATTNTPSLGAASEALMAASRNADYIEPTLGYALAYPFGIIGTILVISLGRFVFGTTAEEASALLAAERAEKTRGLKSITLRVENENLEGLHIDEIPAVKDLGVVISRFSREGSVSLAREDITLKCGDLLQAVGNDEALRKLTIIVGSVADFDLKAAPSELSIHHVVVTSPKVVGKTFAEIKAEERIPVAITRVRRGDVEFAATENVSLHLGDRIRVVGDPNSIKKLGALVGDSPRELQHFQFLPIFVGLLMGVVLGNMEWALPLVTAPIKLGLAGGPLIIALVLSHLFNYRWFPTYVPYGANLALRELGIVLFLASVGLKAGEQFFQVLFSPEGVVWLILGAILTLVPLSLLLWAASLKRMKLNYLSFMGLAAGSMTDPPALSFASSLAPTANEPAVAYATVYPLVMLCRILCGQIVVLLAGLS